jgi:hypothetical protein
VYASIKLSTGFDSHLSTSSSSLLHPPNTSHNQCTIHRCWKRHTTSSLSTNAYELKLTTFTAPSPIQSSSSSSVLLCHVHIHSHTDSCGLHNLLPSHYCETYCLQITAF